MTSSVADLYRARRLPLRAGVQLTEDPEEVRRYKAAGWACVGASTTPGGSHVYWLEHPTAAATAATAAATAAQRTA